MSKPESPDAQKQEPAQPVENKNKRERGKKQRVELPPLVEMMITFSRTAVVLVAVVVALVSVNSGCDLMTIFVRITVSLVSSGLLLWLVSWWVTQQYFEGLVANQKNQIEGSTNRTNNDIKA